MAKVRYNKSEIFKRMWELLRETKNATRSWALRMAWQEAKENTAQVVEADEWFSNFLSSFENCEDRRVSFKQGRCFERNLPKLDLPYLTSDFFMGIVNGRVITVQKDSEECRSFYGKITAYSSYISEKYYVTIKNREEDRWNR